jgi:UDP-N-acetylmuramate--alanine ligase
VSAAGVVPDRGAVLPSVSSLVAVHLLGIGGAGMSALARLFLARGVAVSGSDARASAVTSELEAAGATVSIGHLASQVPPGATLVVSTAVKPDNPELVHARELGLRVLHRSEALAALMAGRRAVAIAGTHGKTTTTGMTTVLLQRAGLDPSFAIGGELTEGGQAAHDGTGGMFVAEADESDGSFLLYRPEVAVVTNVEPDHLDHYGSAEAVEAAFEAFVDRVVDGGLVIACGSDAGARSIVERAAPTLAARGVQVHFYGLDESCDVRIVGLEHPAEGVRFGLLTEHAHLGSGDFAPVTLRVPGTHNALNAAAAWLVARWFGVDGATALAALTSFGGTRRRFELKGTAGGVRVVDDYAHHPTEVEALMKAARPFAGSGRVVVVFQSHLFSRTRIFATEFAAALGLADEVIVLDVYPAREAPEPGVTGELIAARIPLPADRVVYRPVPAEAVAEAAARARPGDVVLTVGAGDVTALGPQILAALAAAEAGAQGGAG